MYSGIFNLFLGLLLQFNIVFRGIDVLPDVVGYYLIYKGLKILVTQNTYFQTANKLILPLMVLSVVNLYNFQYHPDILLSISVGLDIVKTLVFALNMVVVYNLYKGTIEVVTSNNDRFLARNLQQRLYLYLGVSGVFLLLSIVSLFPFTAQGTPLQSVFLVTYITYLFALLIIVGGMYRVYKELSPAKARPVKAKAGGKPAKSGKSGKPVKLEQSKRKR